MILDLDEDIFHIDMRHHGKSGKKIIDTTKPNNVRSINLGQHLINRIEAIARIRGFMNGSEFIRYAIRKELDYQAELIPSQIPTIKTKK